MSGEPAAPDRLRRVLLWLLMMALAGTGVELLLLGHFDDVWQFVPLVLIPLGLAVTGWRLFRPGPSGLRAFRVVMLLMLASGALGLFLHYRGNSEFELEHTPGIAGFALFREAITGATPALAPGAMILFGLLGLASALEVPRKPG